jgi:hypothetical protein
MGINPLGKQKSKGPKTSSLLIHFGHHLDNTLLALLPPKKRFENRCTGQLDPELANRSVLQMDTPAYCWREYSEGSCRQCGFV